MKYKKFEKAIKDLDLGLRIMSIRTDESGFVVRVVDGYGRTYATINKYKLADFSFPTNWYTLLDVDTKKRAKFAKIVTHFATTPIEERAYDPEVRKRQYMVHLAEDLNLIHYGTVRELDLDFANDKDAKEFLWSEQDVGQAMEEIPGLNWDECLRVPID